MRLRDIRVRVVPLEHRSQRDQPLTEVPPDVAEGYCEPCCTTQVLSDPVAQVRVVVRAAASSEKLLRRTSNGFPIFLLGFAHAGQFLSMNGHNACYTH